MFLITVCVVLLLRVDKKAVRCRKRKSVFRQAVDGNREVIKLAAANLRSSPLLTGNICF